jgi:hypothetical protein
LNQFDIPDSSVLPECAECASMTELQQVALSQQTPLEIPAQSNHNSRVEADTKRANQRNKSGYQHFSPHLNTMGPTQRPAHLLDTKGPKF